MGFLQGEIRSGVAGVQRDDHVRLGGLVVVGDVAHEELQVFIA